MTIPVQEVNAKLDTLMRKHFGKKTNLTVAVGILEDGEQHIQGLGLQENESYSSAIYHMGGMSSIFTISLLTIFHQQGLLKLSDQVGKYIPALTDNQRVGAITLYELATHTSGLPRYPNNIKSTTVDKLNPYQQYDESLLLDCLAKAKPKKRAGYHYSDLGIALLGKVLETISGQDLDAVMKEKLFQPLFMEDSGLHLTREQQERLLPIYTTDNKQVEQWDMRALAAAGGLKSSVRDLLQFAKANFRSSTTSVSQALRTCHEPQLNLKGKISLGLGWRMKTGVYHDTIHWHCSGMHGANCFVGFHAEKNTGVVVIANAGRTSLPGLLPVPETQLPVETIAFQMFKLLTKTVY